MGHQVGRVLSTLLVLGVGASAAGVASATAPSGGKESFKGDLIASGASGTRTVVSSIVIARGVFDGVGRIVEVPNRAGDSDAVSRDDLVFAHGTIHIVNTNGAVKLSVDPMTCAAEIRIRQTTRIAGGTGWFSHASGRFAGTVHGWAVAARAADGTCSQDQDALLDGDVFASHGTLRR